MGKSRKPISETHPELAMQAFGWDPSSLTYGSQKSVSWICDKKHVWEQTPNTRTSQGFGCPFCSNKRVLAGYNDLSTTHPDLAAEAFGWDPSEVSKGSNRIQNWKCPLGHIYPAKILNRAINKSNCPVCDGKKIQIGENDLRTTHPLIAEEADGWNPEMINAGSNKRMAWKCSLGHTWVTTVLSRTSGRGCPVCTGRKVLPGFNDLATTHPQLIKEAFDFDPSEYSLGSNKKVKWKCQEGHVWTAMIVSRTTLNSNCPSCAVTGYDQNEKGYLYFLKHPEWVMFQIGITNYPEQRLSRHISKGWELIELRGPMDGLLAKQWESAILKMLSSKGADLSNKSVVGKFDGYSESWSCSTFKVDSIKEMMDLVEDSE